ncbi:uncharacterized protein N7443_007282 [Penicillium atrosanguineum]|uniref:uncharacterized protein n=1 Tax=Penicillium atrosanguineum TaxID=1132637 RepID=UPI00239ADB3D|nr:uncharacterized protein N7443_007282 [Penicillium atrosanguineum]KAJ5296389.1 hypothetical protein N7443_007282 [Penicillium atrosanguineum]
MAAAADKSKPYIPLAGGADDGWSTEDQATATCYCGAVQLAFDYLISQQKMSLDHEVPRELDDTDSFELPQVPESGSASGEPVTDRPQTQWKPSSRTVEETLAEGLSNEDLWMLIRRFNKQIYHVKAVPDAQARDIDLNRADDEQFPPEKLRMTVERFYTSVVVGLTEFFRHVGRLRSWKEPVRTSVSCAVYFSSWFLDLLIPAILSLFVALIMFPPIRTVLFPMAPAKTDSDASSVHSSSSDLPESHDSLTGAPENHKGEAAEQEAKNLVDSVATMAMEGAAAKYGQTVAEDEPDVPVTPQPLLAIEGAPDGQPDDGPEDKTKKPMRSKAAKGTDKAMRVISDITDIYEQFANLFSPTPPFYLVSSRLRLSSILTIIAFVAPFTSSYWIIKGVGFAIGLGFFGDPIFAYTLDMLNQKIPNWQDHLDMQKTLLKGVPTNAQLTLTLLRIGEISSSPSHPRQVSETSSDLASLNSPSTTTLGTLNNEPLPPQKPKRRWVFKLLKFVRRTIATAIRGHIAMDRAMAIAGSAHTKNLLTMLQKRGFVSKPFGPLKFDAKFERKRGAAVIDSSKEPPILYFTTYQSAGLDDLRIESRKEKSVLFQIPVTEIRELKKTEGLGWKGKLIVELTAGSKEAADGLVVGGGEGQSFHLTGMRSRNQLFNRLVAIDAQFWESR